MLDEEERLRHTALLARINAERHKELEDRDFWFRRCFTTLGIANAAGFVALTSGFLQSADRAATAELIMPALSSFTFGMLFAGTVPVMLWLRGEAAAAAKGFEHDALESPTLSEGYRSTLLARSNVSSHAGRTIRGLGFIAAAGSAAMFVLGIMGALGSMNALNPTLSVA